MVVLFIFDGHIKRYTLMQIDERVVLFIFDGHIKRYTLMQIDERVVLFIFDGHIIYSYANRRKSGSFHIRWSY